jgi:hypothetical protein
MLTAGSNSSSDDGSSLHNHAQYQAANAADRDFTPRSSMSSIFDFNNKEVIEK